MPWIVALRVVSKKTKNAMSSNANVTSYGSEQYMTERPGQNDSAVLSNDHMFNRLLTKQILG